jgi:hypothetical protein
MQVRVQIDCRPSAQSSVQGQPSFVAAGFLLLPPDHFALRLDSFAVNCIRLEYRVAGQGDGVEGYAAEVVRDIAGGRRDWVHNKENKDWPFTTKPKHVYLRLGRQFDVLLYQISADGKKWVTVGGGQFFALPSKLQVGFVSCSTSTAPSKVRFDQLKLIRAPQKELLDELFKKQTRRR